MILLATAAPVLAHEDHTHEDEAHAEEHAHDEAHAHDEEHAEDDHAHGDDAHLAEAGGLRLVHAWSRATDGDETLIFVEIENSGDNTRSLIGGGSPHAAAAEVVGFRLVDGTPTYEPLPEVPIAPGTEMSLAPEGLALRLTGLDAALEEGDGLPVTFAFNDGLEIRATAQIEASNATRHSHAGHMH
ncbi:copper chaperone PCu(A)C [Rhodovulum sp. 12E13]|uniref:copper chaperone PCu(A)C n=1 Tax=Rhodovulum sp. 12E13 TaxID=2203891 RepID=UPI000E1B22C7|nr:copper chaperone PCu(A)C [Rhodovulum sp. 12E13]RDC69842.1 copper chaperone PCu(A)C [Rhodovulum sp. 12E13]